MDITDDVNVYLKQYGVCIKPPDDNLCEGCWILDIGYL